MQAHLSLAPPPEFDGEFTLENFARLIEERNANRRAEIARLRDELGIAP